jgi:hypothetical protein
MRSASLQKVGHLSSLAFLYYKNLVYLIALDLPSQQRSLQVQGRCKGRSQQRGFAVRFSCEWTEDTLSLL